MNKSSLIWKMSMLAFSLGIWSFFMGSWTMGLGVIALITVHEVGHMIAARRLGLKASLPEFTPVGAFVEVSGVKSLADETYIKLAGPLVGGLASIATMAVGFWLSLPAMFEVGLFGVFLNLINLIPLDPLDGGALGQSFGRFAWIFGAFVFAIVFWMLYQVSAFNLVFGAVIALGALQSIAVRNQARKLEPAYFAGSWRFSHFFFYLLTGAALYAIYANPALAVNLAILLGAR